MPDLSTVRPIQTSGISLRPLHPAFGAEIVGLDAGTSSLSVLEVLHDALLEHGVLLLRGQPDLPAALARGLAGLEALQFCHGMDDPGPSLVLPAGRAADPWPDAPALPAWHTDRSFSVQPTLFCLVRATDKAGPIGFADQRRALTLLPPGLRARFEPLRAEHVSPQDPAARAEHPLVNRHPMTGEEALYASPAFAHRVLNLSPREGREVLERILAAATDPSVVWQHACQPGDLLIWDNRRILHMAYTTGGFERLRIGGECPVGVARHGMPWVVAG